jgi:hypothetical protein
MTCCNCKHQFCWVHLSDWIIGGACQQVCILLQYNIFVTTCIHTQCSNVLLVYTSSCVSLQCYNGESVCCQLCHKCSSALTHSVYGYGHVVLLAVLITVGTALVQHI